MTTLGTISLNHMPCSMQEGTPVATQFRRVPLARTRHEHVERQRDIRAAALSVIAPMKRRPAPVWDEIARIDRPTRRFELVQEPMRAAVHAGADVDSVCDFYCTLLLDALMAAPQPITFDAASAALRAIREQAESVEAVAVATARPTLANTERAERETLQSISAGHLYVAMARRARIIGRMG
jgi:hypothetical protein